LEVDGKYALDQHGSKGLVDVLELVGIADALCYPTDRELKMAVTVRRRVRVARGRTERLSESMRVHPAAFFLYCTTFSTTMHLRRG
jgi:hypothetical protein